MRNKTLKQCVALLKGTCHLKGPLATARPIDQLAAFLYYYNSDNNNPITFYEVKARLTGKTYINPRRQ